MDHANEQITVTPTTSDGGATVEYPDGDDATIADADGAKECQQVGLFGGENTVKVRVTVGDSTNMETHTVVVIRDKVLVSKVLVSNVGQGGHLLQNVGGNDIGQGERGWAFRAKWGQIGHNRLKNETALKVGFQGKPFNAG